MSTRVLSVILVAVWILASISLPVFRLGNLEDNPSNEGELLESFEKDVPAWDSQMVELSSATAREGSSSLMISWKNEDDAEVYAPSSLSLANVDSVIFEMKLAGISPNVEDPDLKPVLFFKNKDGEWYQVSGRGLVSGTWMSYKFDISHTSVQLAPVHHSAPWDWAAKRHCKNWGFSFASSNLNTAQIHLDNIRFLASKRAEPCVFSLSTNSSELETYEKYEASFDVSPVVDNPFDPAQADIHAVFVEPDGTKKTVNAFYYKPYDRTLRCAVEELTPSGKAEWKVRFTPVMEGVHKWSIEGIVAGKKLSAGEFSFAATKSRNPGFVRIKKDSRYFSFDNGDFFYPIGHNFRSPTDTRTARLLKEATPPDRGTFKYEEVLPKMASNGENSLEVWMASWFTELEWTGEWKNYHGLGDYNLANAWKLDYVVSLAEALGLKIHLVLENHGQISDYCDDEWKNSPYNIANPGGFLTRPFEFWSNTRAFDQYEKKLRYIVARWGYSPAIMAFELVSELDLTGSNTEDYKRSEVLRWHRKTAECIRGQDPNKHLITTHFSQNYRRIHYSLATDKSLDYIVCDAYRSKGDIASLVNETDSRVSVYARKRPYFITEFGGSPHGNTLPALEADLHCGLWSSYMTNAAGAPYFWWFDLIEKENWYHHFRGLAMFNEGEKRGEEILKTLRTHSTGGRYGIHSMAIGSKESGYAWVASNQILNSMAPGKLQEIKNGKLTIQGMDIGVYTIEYWDPLAGEKKETIKATTSTVPRRSYGQIILDLPAFSTDLAIKFRIKKDK